MPRLSYSAACGIFLDQGLNPRLLQRQADSLPLSHQGSLRNYNFWPPLPILPTFYPRQLSICSLYQWVWRLFRAGGEAVWFLTSFLASQVGLVINPLKAGNARDVGLIPVLGRSPGVGNGNPLQCSCLENSMDRGTWWATGHGVAKSQTCWAHITIYQWAWGLWEWGGCLVFCLLLDLIYKWNHTVFIFFCMTYFS